MPSSTVAAVDVDLRGVEINLCFKRADAFTFGFLLQQGGSAIDVTGYTFAFAVSTSPDGQATPSPILFTLAASNTPGASGIVTFLPTTNQMDQAPGSYFYDLQWTTPGGEVLAYGSFQIDLDVTA